MNRILIVGGNEESFQRTADYLVPFGFEVRTAQNCGRALRLFDTFEPEVIVVNQRLPRGDALEVCRQIRKVTNTPILIVDDRNDPFDVICGLELGADGYLVNDSDPRLLLAWLRALLRRASELMHPHASDEIVFGRLRIVPLDRVVYWREQRLEISRMHFELLVILARRAGRVVSRTEIVSEMRGLQFDTLDRSIDMAVARLRKCVGDTLHTPRKIRTERGRGYILCPRSWD